MSKLALVTGGTSGIGAAFARRLANEGYDLVLVARDRQRLDEVASQISTQHRVHVDVLEADLATDEGVETVATRLEATERPVDFFVNNAGFGLKGTFLETTRTDHDRMLRVNVRAAHLLMHAAANSMTQRGGGDIVNVASVAAFTPGFRSSGTYGATKAFVVAASEGVAPFLARSGVRVSALCPGFVATEFHQRAGIDMSKMPKFMWLDADDVVTVGLRDHRNGKVVVVPGIIYKLIVGFSQLLPRSLVRALGRAAGKRSH